MPRPVYIICSQSGTEDKYTGLLSHFDVVEKLLITKIDASSELSTAGCPSPLRIVSVWMKNEDDADNEEYEYKTSLSFPPTDTKRELSSGRFEFAKPLHRISVEIVGWLPIQGSGVMWVESKIRNLSKSDQTAWISQTYPIFLEVTQKTNV